MSACSSKSTHPLPMEDSAVLVFLSLSLMSWRSASKSLVSSFSSFDATDKNMMHNDLEEIESLREIFINT